MFNATDMNIILADIQRNNNHRMKSILAEEEKETQNNEENKETENKTENNVDIFLKPLSKDESLKFLNAIFSNTIGLTEDIDYEKYGFSDSDKKKVNDVIKKLKKRFEENVNILDKNMADILTEIRKLITTLPKEQQSQVIKEINLIFKKSMDGNLEVDDFIKGVLNGDDITTEKLKKLALEYAKDKVTRWAISKGKLAIFFGALLPYMVIHNHLADITNGGFNLIFWFIIILAFSHHCMKKCVNDEDSGNAKNTVTYINEIANAGKGKVTNNLSNDIGNTANEIANNYEVFTKNSNTYIRKKR